MESPLIKLLVQKVDELKGTGVSEISIINALKEDLQYYLLNFIYKSDKYSHFVMYGGSVLRIGYELPRMSEDLDFQTGKEFDINKFKYDIEEHFEKTYNLIVDAKVKDRSHFDTKLCRVVFDILQNFDLDTPKRKLVVRIDVNIFPLVDHFINDTIPINKDNLSFIIKTYPLSTLMASKAMAFLQRTERDIGGKKTNCKPRDVYDMMWYMEQRMVPDLEYLKANNTVYSNFLHFRDAVKLRASKLEDNLFKQDLAQFFYRPSDFEDWFNGWRERFYQLLDRYDYYEVDKLKDIQILVDWSTEVTHIKYNYLTKDNTNIITFIANLSSCWYDFADMRIKSGSRIAKIESQIRMVGKKELRKYDYKYAGLFYSKIKKYLQRVDHVVSQKRFETKLIRATSERLNVKKQVFLDRRLLRNIQFEELL